MAKYVYPAVFEPEEQGAYSILFPDIPGCYTCGNNLYDGLEMAADALALMLTHLEDENRCIPAPAKINDIHLDLGAFATYISCDTTKYRRLINNLPVKNALSAITAVSGGE